MVKTDGTLWVTGKDDVEQLGLGYTAHRNTLNQIAGVTSVSKVMAGGHYSLFIKTDNSIWVMGGNAKGEFADGTNIQKTSPVLAIPGD